MNWKGFLRTVMNISIWVSIIGDFILATQIGKILEDPLGSVGSFFVGLIVFAFLVLFTFISVSMTMIILDAADDIEIIRMNVVSLKTSKPKPKSKPNLPTSAKVVLDNEVLDDSDDNDSSEEWECKECGEFNPSDEFACNNCGTYIA